ncbi:unnamed protein product [Ilex paraguariensis]|uniref:Uncharacterized protein n=1 Tax=Ilex paraguariensis TaxID=185542 RepID=A0ABC8TFQ0_9AQUA
MGALKPKLKQASLLWLEGFKEACCLHRVIIYCLRSSQLLIRTGQCFLLNGFIFLGSILTLKSVIIPTLLWILPDQCPQFSSQEPYSFGGVLKFYSFIRLGLIQLFYYPYSKISYHSNTIVDITRSVPTIQFSRTILIWWCIKILFLHTSWTHTTLLCIMVLPIVCIQLYHKHYLLNNDEMLACSALYFHNLET